MTDWTAIPDFPRYEISTDGRVRSLGAAGGLRRFPRIKKQCIDKDGYHTVALCVGTMSKTKTRRVSRLVLEAFVGPCPAGKEAAHRNGVCDDDRLDNLEWKTPVANHADKHVHGTMYQGSEHHNAKITEDLAKAIRSAEGEARAIAEGFGVSIHIVRQIRSGRTWKHA